MLYDGAPVAEALVFSHTEQVKQLADAAPAAIPTAVIAGDPCYDRIVASLPFRARYRSALNIGDRTLVLVSSTWSSSSLLGTRPQLIRELIAELPRDSYVVAAVLHPNISHGHGPGQIRHWLADCVRSGLIILPEIDGWRTGLIAADVVIGDNGSVTGYAAAIGRPTVLAAFDDDVPPQTPISTLGQLVPRLPATGPFARHLDAAITEHTPEISAQVSDLVTSEPGRSLDLLRSLFYQLLGLDEPDAEVPLAILPTPDATERQLTPFADIVSAEVDVHQRTITLVRRPAEVQRAAIGLGYQDSLGETHLSCSVDHPMRSLRNRAEILTGIGADTSGDIAGWLHATLDHNLACTLAVVIDGHTSTVLYRDGTTITLRSAGLPPETLASAIYSWSSAGYDLGALNGSLTVQLGATRHEVTIDLG